MLFLNTATLGRLQLIAVTLAKSVVLAQYETTASAVFAEVEPLAGNLARTGRTRQNTRNLLRHIGGTLAVQHKMVGRVEVTEKPELLWENPDLERLYLLLTEEYELRERHSALERKLDVISETAQTLLELLRTGRSHRVEWYIVALIAVEIALTIYTTFIRSGGH